MTEPVEFRVDRGWVALFQVGGIAALAVAGFAFSSPWLDAEVSWWMAGGIGVFALAAAASSFRAGFQPKSYSVQMSDDGVRLPSEGRWAPWSQIAGLKERLFLQRVDLIDRSGARFASLEYQLERFSEALETAVAGMRVEVPDQDVFRRAISSPPVLIGLVAGVGLCAFGTWYWLARGETSGLLLAAILIGALGYEAMTEIWSVSLLPEGVQIQRGPRKQLVPWRDVAKVELDLRHAGRGSQLLDVFLVQTSGARERIRPMGANPFHLKARLADRLTRTRAGG